MEQFVKNYKLFHVHAQSEEKKYSRTVVKGAMCVVNMASGEDS